MDDEKWELEKKVGVLIRKLEIRKEEIEKLAKKYPDDEDIKLFKEMMLG